MTALAAPAEADQPDCPPGTTPSNPGGGIICIPVEDPGGDPGEEPGGSNPGGGGDRTGCVFAGREIPCTRKGLTWFGAPQDCYAFNVSDLYPPGSPLWEEHPDGSLWSCVGAGPTQAPASGYTFWVPPGAAPAIPDPAELARRALEQLNLAVPNVHMAPQPPLMTYVGLETWLWIDPGQWQKLRLTVTAGATSVTVTAEPVVATWSLTEGSTTCASPGRAWVSGMGDSERTDCSYTFSRVSDGQPDDAFPVSAVLTYQVDWTCTGACLAPIGTLGQVDGLPGTSAIRVGERQSVVVR